MHNKKIIGIQKNLGAGILFYSEIKEFMDSINKIEELTKKSIYKIIKSFVI